MSNPADKEKDMKQAALDYHSIGQKGKLEVVPTKPCLTQWDLSLAYSPGVAEPCLEIAKDPHNVYEYTFTLASYCPSIHSSNSPELTSCYQI